MSHPNLDGVLSPQTIYQSAVNGVPISGRVPAPEKAGIDVKKVKLTKLPPPPHGNGPPKPVPPLTAEIELDAHGPGTAHVFLWSGDPSAIPVFLTSCALNPDPIQMKDYGLSACALTDGGIPPWSPDMSGRVVAQMDVDIQKKGKTKVTFDLTQAQYDKLATDGIALISFETPNDEVQAIFVPSLEKTK